nr:PA2778 family cysteine peptidase [Pseudomonas cavernae]
MTSLFCFNRNSLSLLKFFLVTGLLLGGCQGPGNLPVDIQRLPERVELSGVPFFAESAFDGAPGALATVLSQQGVVTTPGLVAKQLKLPEAELQLAQNIPRVAREQGFVVYPLGAGLAELLDQVAAGFPVLVRFSEGLGWMASSRYAVLVGYDRAQQTLLLRSGQSKRWLADFTAFKDDWEKAGRWSVLVQAPARLPASVDPLRWRQAAAELERVGQVQAAASAYQALEAPSQPVKSKTAP